LIQKKVLMDGEYVKIRYSAFEESREIALSIMNEYLPVEKEIDAENIGFTSDYTVTEIIYPKNERFYIIDDFVRKELFLIHNNNGKITEIYDMISDKINSSVISTYFNNKQFYVKSDEYTWCYAEQSVDGEKFNNEYIDLEIEVEGINFTISPLIRKGDKGHIIIFINCSECIDILTSLIFRIFKLKEEIKAD